MCPESCRAVVSHLSMALNQLTRGLAVAVPSSQSSSQFVYFSSQEVKPQLPSQALPVLPIHPNFFSKEFPVRMEGRRGEVEGTQQVPSPGTAGRAVVYQL